MNKFLNEERIKKIEEITKDEKLEKMLNNYIEQLYNKINIENITKIDVSSYLNELFYMELCSFPRITNRIKDVITLCYYDKSLIYNLRSLYTEVAQYENLKDRHVMRRDINQFFNKYTPKYHLGKIYKYLSISNSDLISPYLESVINYIDSEDEEKVKIFNPYSDEVNELYNDLFTVQNEITKIIIKESIEYILSNNKKPSISEIISYISLKYNINIEMKKIYLALSKEELIKPEEESISESFELRCNRVFEKIYEEAMKKNKQLIYKD